jgi:hypothetical protein
MTDKTVNLARESRPAARRGKIARLPNDIREQLNQRLLDGHSASVILPWLNHLQPVKEILAAQFNGESITPQNLSNWRVAGYQHWLQGQKRLSQIKQFGQYASTLSSARRDQMAAGTAALASFHLFEFLQSASAEQTSLDGILKLTSAVRPFLEADQDKVRLKLLASKIHLRDAEFQLKFDKYQRDPVDTPHWQGQIHPNPD